MFRLFILVIALFVQSYACKYDECKYADLGSCGNACCKLEAFVDMPTLEVMNKLNSTITEGGPDKQYKAAPLADGGGVGFSDLRKYNIDVDFLGQTFHTTDNGVYVDTVNLLLYPLKTDAGTRIKAFSISQIGGAYGDDGQNYYNIFNLINSVFPSATLRHVDSSCPPPKS